MEFIEGISPNLPEHLRSDLFKYRYNVFVEQLGWELDTPHGREIDQFDHDETLYVIARNDRKDVIGCARLLPTTSPYLLEEVFPELLNGLPIPKSSDVWELSRFTSMDIANGPLVKNAQFSTEVTLDLLKHSIRCAQQYGAKRIISVSPIGIERLLRKAGIKAHRAGPPKIIDGYPLIACWIECDQDVLTA
ncbi:acyl-homoserine-lactone synthase [Litoribacillus peritrichatus]|uniref:Acyl-homoserine-lactone synthase n=1 Tax=Litoribacillus peritrichatus TaxID=718191 RepID=A0ABP7MQT2_9GAMM